MGRAHVVCVGLVTGRLELKAESAPTLHEAIRLLHFDLAGLPVPELLTGPLKLADPSHLYYGSDLPFTKDAVVAQLLDDLETT